MNDRVNIALRRFLHIYGNIATEQRSKSGLCHIIFERFQGFFMVHSHISSTAHFRRLTSLEHCICTASITMCDSELSVVGMGSVIANCQWWVLLVWS